jgi:hypothetical protein
VVFKIDNGGRKMKKLAIGIGILFLIALAVPAFAVGNGAVVGRDYVCGIYTGEYGTPIPWVSPDFGFLFTENAQYVINDNVWKLTCHGQITENLPTGLVKYESTSGCQPFGPGSIDSDVTTVVITPSGQVILTCMGTFV